MNPSPDPDEYASPLCPDCGRCLHWWEAESIFVCLDCIAFYKLTRWPQIPALEILSPSVH